jgi:hypothetical protein
MYPDTFQGQGFQRNIVMNGTPHLPAYIRQWWGDSRGRWEGNTLVIDVTNFSPKSAFQGLRENLHLIERWTRTVPDAFEYKVSVEDPTVWTAAWTAIQEFTKQSDADNKIDYQPRCYEGNYAQPSMMPGARLLELVYAEGRGPHPSTFDGATDFGGGEWVRRFPRCTSGTHLACVSDPSLALRSPYFPRLLRPRFIPASAARPSSHQPPSRADPPSRGSCAPAAVELASRAADRAVGFPFWR